MATRKPAWIQGNASRTEIHGRLKVCGTRYIHVLGFLTSWLAHQPGDQLQVLQRPDWTYVSPPTGLGTAAIPAPPLGLKGYTHLTLSYRSAMFGIHILHHRNLRLACSMPQSLFRADTLHGFVSVCRKGI